MSLDFDTTDPSEPQHSDFRLQLATDAFAEFCDEERDRRSDSDESFDETLYQEAVQLVLSHLSQDALEVEA